MKRFTKRLAAVVAVVGVGFAGQRAGAAPPVVSGPVAAMSQRIGHDHVVFYRPARHGPWVEYGRYETLVGARVAERHLERHGYAVMVEPVPERHHGWFR